MENRKVTFRFKSFEIDDSHCGMKVGTDGVVLGAWASCESVRRAIDVGSGSGLIALMLCQRGTEMVECIETDSGACRDATANIALSPWSDRIRISQGSFADFASESTHVDLIVSNPPFFADGEHAPETARALARHEGDLNYSSLIDFATQRLTKDGRLALIYPYGHEDAIIYKAEMSHLKLRRICHLRQRPGAKWVRTLYEFSPTDGPISYEQLTIRNSSGSAYTAEYAALCRDFYLEL